MRGALGEQARNFGNKASEQYRQARATHGRAEWAGRKGREFVNQARDAVTRGAEEARGYAGVEQQALAREQAPRLERRHRAAGSFGSGSSGSDFGRS